MDTGTELAPGFVVAGRYRIEKCVGKGGMGAVYLVRHTVTDERLALKVLHAQVLADALAVERFRREARAPAQIDSDHVVRVTDADTAPEIGGAPFLVMEFLKGNDLDKEVETRGSLPPQEVVLYLKQVARALDKAHGMGIIHRDLKPENLFLTRREDGSPCVKILDFGIAKITGGSAQQVAAKTETGTIAGTPFYMAPEQIKGETNRIAPQTDIWALGVITHRLLSGQMVWTADTLPTLVAQIAYEPLPAASSRGATNLGPAYDAWFTRCCARDQAQRFQTAGEAIQALEAAIGNVAAEQPLWRAATVVASPTGAAMGAPAPSPAFPSLEMSTPPLSHTMKPQKKSMGAFIGGAIALVVIGGVTLKIVNKKSHDRDRDSREGEITVTAPSTPGGPAVAIITDSTGTTSIAVPIPIYSAIAPHGSSIKGVTFSSPAPSTSSSAKPVVSTNTTVIPPPSGPTVAPTTTKPKNDTDLLNSQH